MTGRRVSLGGGGVGVVAVGTTPNNMASYRAQMLWDNITSGDLSAVHAILENGHVNLEERDQSGCTFLMLASELGQVGIVRELLQAGVDPNAVDNENWSALLCASKQGYLEIVMDLLEKNADVEHADMCGWTALMWACYKGRDLVVNELLERGANSNVKADLNMNCLSWGAGRGWTEIVKMLIDKGAKVDIQDKYGTTPLIWACRKGHCEIVETLLAEGASADASGLNSWTPLLVATKGGYFEIVQALLNQDPNVNATDKDGLTALAIAAKDGKFEIVNDLLAKGAYVNVLDKNGDSILIHAVKGGYVEEVRALLKKYVDVDVQGQDGKTALYCAVEKSYTEIVRILLQSSPDLEICTKDGDTALLRAVRTRKEECVRMLLDKGARVSASDKRGDTALHIAIRARTKRITELLLRNPKHSRLQYRLNKAGESPYTLDTYFQRGILPQIHGHGNLNATDAENLLGYEIYSSALADILSEPGLITPLIMGLYAKWGSGKSFLLTKLTSEMASFAHQNSPIELTWSWLTAFLILLFNCFLGEGLGLALGWHIGLAVGLGLLPIEYGFIGIIIFFTKRYDFAATNLISSVLGRKQRLMELLMQMLFCTPKVQSLKEKQQSTGTFSVRFLFSDCTRLTSVGGENSLAAMIGTLCDAVEKEYGGLISRLYRVFKSSTNKSRTSRFKSICCIPYFLLVLFVLACLMTGVGLAIGFGTQESVATDSAMIAMASVVGLALIANLYTWGQSAMALAFSQKRQIIKAAERVDVLKMDGFMQQLKTEVDLMSGMVSCMDSFTNDQTRLVVIVDGLDSCEQTKVLQVLDTVKSLFSDEGSPFVTILAVDPQIIIKGIEQNLRSSYQDTNVNGFDYLRNIVHLPFYLQSQGIRIQQVEAPPSSHTGQGESPSRPQRQDSTLTATSSDTRHTHKTSRNMGSSHYIGGSVASSLPGMIYASSFDLTTTIAKNDYFSDINPRSMRRLMNIVAVTARLLRAYNIEFKWHRLAAWINLTEQWPYRLSWIIYFFEEADIVENATSLNSLYQRILPSIPATKEQDPLLEIDRNVRKLEASLTSKSGNFPLLNVADLRKFLPCTTNLDPYLRKLIRETQHNLERHQAEIATLGGVFPPPPPPPAVTGNLIRDAPAERTGLFQSSPSRFAPMAQTNPFLYGLYGSQSQVPLAAMQHPGLMLPFMQIQQQQLQQQQQQLNQAAALAKGENKANFAGSTIRLPKDFFTDLTKPVFLSKCSVDDICNLLSRLVGLNPNQVRAYQTSIRDNNISGLVLSMCDMSDLQPVINMKFGDWQLFRSAVECLKDSESLNMSAAAAEEPSNPAMLSSQMSSGSSASAVTTIADVSQLELSRSNSLVQNCGSNQPQAPKTDLQKIRAVRMRRNDSIVQQLSYESAILRSAVAGFVEESEEEGEEAGEEEAEESGVGQIPGSTGQQRCHEKMDDVSLKSTTPVFSLRTQDSIYSETYSESLKTPMSETSVEDSTYLVSDSVSETQNHFDESCFESSALKSMKISDKEELNRTSGVDSVSTVSGSIPSTSKADIKSTLSFKDIMPFVQVLDEPQSYQQGSSEFVPLLDDMQNPSVSGSSDFLRGTSATSSSVELPAESSFPSTDFRYTAVSDVSNSNPVLASSSDPELRKNDWEKPAVSSLQQLHEQKHTYGSQDSRGSTYSSGSTPASPTHLVASFPASTIVEADVEGERDHLHQQQPHHKHNSALHTLASSIERLTRPLVSSFRHSHPHQDDAHPHHHHHHHHHHQSQHHPHHHHDDPHPSRRQSDQSSIESYDRWQGSGSPHSSSTPVHPHEDLVDRSRSTVVEMFSRASEEESSPSGDFHSRLAQAFAQVADIDSADSPTSHSPQPTGVVAVAVREGGGQSSSVSRAGKEVEDDRETNV